MQNQAVQTIEQPLGQICEGSEFGEALTHLARHSDVIVEIGGWHGQGSTRCLMAGIERHEQRLISVEIDPALHAEASRFWEGYDQITLLCGRIGDGFEPYTHPGGEDQRGPLGYDFLRGQFMAAPIVLDQIPEKIDLLLLDGGEWSSSAELDILLPRGDIICLDDTNPERAHKNVRNRAELIRLRWRVIADDLDDRNGWCAFRRPDALDAAIENVNFTHVL